MSSKTALAEPVAPYLRHFWAVPPRRFFIHDDGQIVFQFDTSDAGQPELTHRYLWGSQTDQLLADEQVDNANSSAEVYWPLTDHLGTIRDIVEYIEVDNVDGDDIGTMVEKHRFYDSFGVLRAERTRGDFNNNGVYDSEDIDALFALVGTNQFNEHFDDLDGDGEITDADVDILIEQVINTVYGDGTLDGVVDISDFSVWNTHKFTNGDGWDTGDYNGDGVVDISDFAEWSANKWTSNSEFDLELTKHQFGYTGRLFDEVTGLQNNLNRWYDPELGRWISEDPIGFAAGDPNIHRYVGNGPTNWIDPDGLDALHPLWGPEGPPKPVKVPSGTISENTTKSGIENFFEFWCGTSKSKDEILDDVPKITPDTVEGEFPKKTGVSSHEHTSVNTDEMDDDEVVGTTGTDPCIGIVVCHVEDNRIEKITACHIYCGKDDPSHTLTRFNIDKDDKVFVFGGNEDQLSREQLLETLNHVRRRGADVSYSNTTGLYVDKDGNPVGRLQDHQPPNGGMGDIPKK